MKRVTRSSRRTASRPRPLASAAVLAALSLSSTTSFADPSKDACIAAATDGQRLRDGGHWRSAKERFGTCTAQSCPGVVRQECAKWLSELNARMPTVVFGAKTKAGVDRADVRVTVDGAAFLPLLDGAPKELDPGPHHVHFATEDGLHADSDVVLRVGEPSRLVVVMLEGATATAATTPPPPVLAPPPPPPSSKPSLAPIVITGGLAVLAGVGTVVLVAHAHDQRDTLLATCAPSCSDSATSGVRTSLTMANVSLAVGLLAAGAFTYFTIARATHGPSVSLAPSVTGSSAGGAVLVRY